MFSSKAVDVYSLQASQQDSIIYTADHGQQDETLENGINSSRGHSGEQQQQQLQQPYIHSSSPVNTEFRADASKSRRQSHEGTAGGIAFARPSASVSNKSRASASLPSSVVIATKEFSDDEIVEDCSSDENGSNFNKPSVETLWRRHSSSNGEASCSLLATDSSGNKQGRKKVLRKLLKGPSKVDTGQSLLTDSWSKVSSVVQSVNADTSSVFEEKESHGGQSSAPLSKLRSAVNSWSDMFRPALNSTKGSSGKSTKT